MGIARSLFLAVTGAASLGVACVVPWQDSSNLDMSPPPQGDASITPTGGSAADATMTQAQAFPRARETPDADAPATPPEIATLAPRTALGQPQKEATLPPDRFVLAQQLQRELARVGCYEGEPTGIWTPAARKAMKAFVERINATLPTEEPDYILLALVRSARDKVCGATCPAGQGLADGRCMPNAILAGKKAPQTARTAASLRTDPVLAVSSSSATRTPTEAMPSDAARMGLSGPSPQSGPGQPDAQPPTADLPVQPPAPIAAHTSGASRRADAKRAAAQGGGFTLNFFSQLGKLGY
jgi:hypothetical protein